MITALVINAIISSPVYGGAGLWVNALEEQYGWGRTQLAIAFSLGQLEGSVVAPLVGYLLDRFGGKKVSVTGAIIAAIGFLCLSQTIPVTDTRDHWLDPTIFYIAYVIIMLGVSLAAWIPMTFLINNWFNKNRSLAMSIGSSGFSLGTFAIVPLLAILMDPEHLGWKTTAFCIAIIFLIATLPLYLILKNRPEDIGEVQDGYKSHNAKIDRSIVSEAQNHLPDEFSIGEALKEKVFWIITFGHASSAMLTSTMMVHLILAFKSQGIALQNAALIWGIAMGFGAFSHIIGGIIGDRTPKHLAICGFGCVQAIGVGIAVYVHTIPMAILFAVVYGMGFGARAPITTAMRGEYFGRKSFGKIMGFSAMPMMFVTMIAPIFSAQLFDRTGNYDTAFLTMSCLGIAGSLLFLFARKPVHPSRRKIF